MANLVFKKSSSKKDAAAAVVGKSKHHHSLMSKCKKHPKHKQSPGVCSLCLREKLTQLSSSTSSSSSSRSVALESYCSSSSSSLSSYYSSSASSCSSPMYTGLQGKHSLSTLLFGGVKNKVLTKSRSLAFVPRIKNKQSEAKKKQNGIFSKLLKPRSKKIDDGLVHSRTLRDIIVTS